MLYPTSVPVRDNRKKSYSHYDHDYDHDHDYDYDYDYDYEFCNKTTGPRQYPQYQASLPEDKKEKKERKKEETAQQRAVVKEKEQEEDEGKRCGIKDLLCKTTHEELLKPFVGNPSIPPIAPPKPAGGLKKDGTPEMGNIVGWKSESELLLRARRK